MKHELMTIIGLMVVIIGMAAGAVYALWDPGPRKWRLKSNYPILGGMTPTAEAPRRVAHCAIVN